jgi:hypothetical protein
MEGFLSGYYNNLDYRYREIKITHWGAATIRFENIKGFFDSRIEC